MAKYRRSARGGSFRPEQVSERGESRLQEYSDRIARGLREERDAVISNRNDIANAMQENAQIESQQASTNASIEEQNLQTKLNDIQEQNNAAMRQFELDTRNQGQIFKDISNLSLTASKKLQEIEVERLLEKWKGDFIQTLTLGDNDPNVKFLEALLKDADAKKVEGYTAINAGLADGMDELDASTAAKRIRELSYGTKLALFNKIGQQYPTYLNERFMDNTVQYTDSEGNTFTGNQAARNAERTSIVAGAAMQSYLDLSQLTGTNPALLQKSGLLNTMLSQNQSAMKTARRAQLEDDNFTADTNFNSQIANSRDAVSATKVIETEWPDLVNRYGLEGAHNYLTSLFKTVDSDGNSVYNEQSLFAAKLGPGGKTWGETWDKRREDIQKTLASARDSAFRSQESRRQNGAIQDYRSIKAGLLEQLAAAGARKDQDILSTAIKEFKDKYEGYVPPQLLDLQRSTLAENKQEAEAKLEAVQQLASDGQLTQGQVLSIQDPTMRAQAQELLNEQNKTSRFGRDYQETLKALKQDAKLIAKDSLEGGSSSAAVEVQLFMEKQFAAWYKEGLNQNNNDPTAALAYARQKHQSELAKSKSGDTSGLYYRKYGDNNGSVYPNIQEEQKRTNAVIDANNVRIENTIGSIGAAALDSPGLLGPSSNLRNISQTHYTGGSIAELITPEIKTAARILGISEMEAINRQIDAYNKFNEDKINRIESPSLDLVNDALPETQRLFTDLPTVRSVERGAYTILKTPLRDPANMRMNLPVTDVSGYPDRNDPFIVAIGINEGTRTAGGGTTSAYAGHTDPGDQAANRGTFSYAPSRFGTDPNMTPEQADAAYMPRLINANNKYSPILKQMGYQEGSVEYAIAMFNIMDLTVQAPAAVDDFVKIGLRDLVGQTLNADNVGTARANAFYNQRTGQLEAGGFGNNFERLKRDQRARSMTIVTNQRN